MIYVYDEDGEVVERFRDGNEVFVVLSSRLQALKNKRSRELKEKFWKGLAIGLWIGMVTAVAIMAIRKPE